MRLTLRKLHHLVVLAETRNFSRAAEQLCISQPALSRSIASIETEFGVQLFERAYNQIAPTTLGQMVLDQAAQILNAADQLEYNIVKWGRGEAGLAAFGAGPLPASLFLPDLLARISGANPGLNVRTTIAAGGPLQDQLDRGHIEFLVCAENQLPRREGYQIAPLGEAPLGCFVRSSHPLAGRSAVSVEELRRFPMIGGGIEGGRPRGGFYDPAIECDNYHLLKDVVLESDAVWMTSPLLVAEELNDQRMAPLDLEGAGHLRSVRFVLVARAGRRLSPAAQRVCEYLHALAPKLGAPTATEARRR